MRPVPHSEQLSAPKLLENLAFSNDISNSDKDHKQQDRENFVIGHLKEVVPHLNPIY